MFCHLGLSIVYALGSIGALQKCVQFYPSLYSLFCVIQSLS
jgi:hypothetical protein